jgi:hypothetical protein
LDTQADISLVKRSALNNYIKLQNDKINIKGITNEIITSHGSYQTKFFIPDYTLSCKLHVVPNTFDIPVDGIIGRDFLKEFNANINYENMVLTLNVNNYKVDIPITDESNDDCIVIPGRSEFIRLIFIPAQELAPGICVASSICNKNYPYVRFVNVNSTNTVVNIKNIMSYPLDDFEVLENNQPKFKKQCDLNRKNKLLEILSKNIPAFSKEKLINLCEEFSDIFVVEGDKLTVNNFYSQKLRLADNNPVYIKNYRTPHSQKEEINKQIDNLLKNELIEPSISNYNSPIILVPKKGNEKEKKWRLCIDYRQLNKKLVPDKYPLPRIEDILDQLGRAKFFSVLDLQSGFHQIPIEKNSRDITSFSTEKGAFRWKVLPFGLNVSPNSFSRMMNLAFSGLDPQTCFLYIDDLIVIGCSQSHHLKNLTAVFQTCRHFNLKLNPQKCQFFRTEVTYLGHKCTNYGLLPDPSKNDAIKNYPTPCDKDAARRFVAFANYYRRFIKNFAAIAKPINNLTKKTTEFKWSEECENSFQKLKNALLTPPILQYPNFSKQFILTVDASNLACGAVLSQEQGDIDLPISFASKTFQKGDLNKPTIEKELLAIYWAIKYFRPYIYGTEFLVKSDHKPLVYLFSLKNPSSKLSNIRLELSEYSFSVEYIKGKTNVCADALSRISIDYLKSINLENEKIFKVQTRSSTNSKQNIVDKDNVYEVTKNNLHMVEIQESRNKNINKIPILKFTSTSTENRFELNVYITSDISIKKTNEKNINTNFKFNINDISKESLNLDSMFKTLENEASKLKIKELKMFKNDDIFKFCNLEEFKNKGNNTLKLISIFIINKPKLVADPDEKIKILEKFHDHPIFGGHAGQKRTLAKIRVEYYWKGMGRDIGIYIKNCLKCQKNKPKTKTKEALTITPTPEKPFDQIVIDTIGPFLPTQNGNKYAVTMICNLSKFLITAPTKTKEAKEVAKAIFDNFILIYGPMKNILTDQGTEYKNEVIKELTNLLQIEHHTSTPYHHETVGSVERNHRVFNEYLRSYLEDTQIEWEEYLKYFTFCYNITPSFCFDLKFTPYELVYNKKPVVIDFLSNNTVSPCYNIENFSQEAKLLLQKNILEARRMLKQLKINSKDQYDKTIVPINIKIGDKVLLVVENRKKFDPLYSGPYVVKEIDGTNAHDRKGTFGHLLGN